MARLYADEHVPVQLVYALRRLGNDVVTVRETSESKSGDATPDDLVLKYAAQQQRVVLTFNGPDFRRLHAENQRHSGILCCDSEFPGKAHARKQARRIDAFLRANNLNSRIEKLPPA
ncbi:MAG TPA: DUF5615 family PIN-like protein [Pirellulales bacterium]|nr:DUF5615 family PIN-like protein [Pirellulales bacterium]